MLFTIIKSHDKRQTYLLCKGWKTDAENITHYIIQCFQQNSMNELLSNLVPEKKKIFVFHEELLHLFLYDIQSYKIHHGYIFGLLKS